MEAVFSSQTWAILSPDARQHSQLNMSVLGGAGWRHRSILSRSWASYDSGAYESIWGHSSQCGLACFAGQLRNVQALLIAAFHFNSTIHASNGRSNGRFILLPGPKRTQIGNQQLTRFSTWPNIYICFCRLETPLPVCFL